MSVETRNALVNNGKLVLANHTQKAQLLDTNCTNTWLIQFLTDLIRFCPRPVLITAINTDHSSGTWHNPHGRAVDCWNADWASAGDDKVVDVMQAANKASASQAPALIEVGLSGTAAYYISYVSWNCKNVFIEEYDKSNEHLHFAVGVPT